MNEEIKKRIADINNGIIPEGYKKTKVGIVPVEWEEKKIKDYLVLSERPIILEDSKEYELVTVRRGFVGVDSRGKQLGESILVKNYYQLKENDFLISKRQIAHGACGIVPLSLSGAVVSNEYNVFTAKKDLDVFFFNMLMQHPYYKKLFYLMSDGVHIEKLLFKTKDWMKRKLPFPPLPEQQKIAEILSTQDKLIELQERKINQLKTLKKGYLQKMFPKKGSKYPELRFKGFTDAWEQRKLSDLCSLFTDGDWIEAKDQSTEGVRLVQTGNVGVTQYLDNTNNAKWISEDTFSRLKCEEIFDGDILISRLPDPAGRACIMPNLGTKMITAVDCTIVRTLPDVNSEYLVQYLSTERYFKEINACLAGGTRQRVSRGNLAEFDIPLPNSADEQRAIGNYFKSLDNLITLHQRKLYEEKQKKKALMQLLLTGKVRVK